MLFAQVLMHVVLAAVMPQTVMPQNSTKQMVSLGNGTPTLDETQVEYVHGPKCYGKGNFESCKTLCSSLVWCRALTFTNFVTDLECHLFGTEALGEPPVPYNCEGVEMVSVTSQTLEQLKFLSASTNYAGFSKKKAAKQYYLLDDDDSADADDDLASYPSLVYVKGYPKPIATIPKKTTTKKTTTKKTTTKMTTTTKDSTKETYKMSATATGVSTAPISTTEKTASSAVKAQLASVSLALLLIATAWC
mmetsp:Transcript_30267/g.59378  ORF Transcript_30267/g.59378 Transcript_30267/m.59378 type:complete len:248 (+) Transcript_30267:41-784(+)